MFKKIYYLAAVLTASLFFAAPSFGATLSPQDSDAPYDKQGATTCLECHDEAPTVLILNTPHAQSGDSNTPFASHACESCHGASPEHMRKVEGETVPPLPAITFGIKSKTPVAEQNAVCLDCHESGMRINWDGSEHDAADTTCVSCHAVHAHKDPALVKKEQPEVCYECHKDQQADSHKRSHHPISEGKVTCSDCHNPHGSGNPKLLKQASANDTCYTCHTEKRGPFLWEHAPVRDDCTSCHATHGSTQPRLLKARAPWLCQECHQEAYHPSTLYSGSSVAPLGAGERIVSKQCMTCHPKVHGSNHPSGSRLTR